MGSPLLPLVASLALAASAFLPWLRLGDIGLAGVPDPAGLFVLALGVVGAVFSLMRLLKRSETRQWLMLVGMAGLTVLIVVWRTGPETIADRAQAHAEAVALVDNVPMQPVPVVRIGAGLWLGLVSSAALLAAGLSGIVRRPEI